MRGSPAIRLMIIVISMGLILIPLRHVTSKSVAPALSRQPEQKATAESIVRLAVSATAPFDFEILHLGKTIWKGEASATKQETELKMPFPAEGIELVVLGEIKSEAIPAAIKLSVASSQNAEIEKTVWAESKAVDEVLLFKP